VAVVLLALFLLMSAARSRILVALVLLIVENR
jgi:hypothetical protein